MSDSTVYTKRRHLGGGNMTYHTDLECPALKQANEVQEREQSQIFDDWSECQWCRGEVTRSGGSGEKLANKLEAMGSSGT